MVTSVVKIIFLLLTLSHRIYFQSHFFQLEISLLRFLKKERACFGVRQHKTSAICVIPFHEPIEEMFRNIKSKDRTFSTDFFFGWLFNDSVSIKTM